MSSSEPWREAARSEISALKPYYVEKNGWHLEVDDRDNALDLFVSMTGKHLHGRRYELRLRYLPDWQVAGRREAFVDPDARENSGPRYWPAKGDPPILIQDAPLNPNYQHNGSLTPVICLRGVWGYHSVLHADQSAEGHPLLRFLVELQEVLDR